MPLRTVASLVEMMKKLLSMTSRSLQTEDREPRGVD